MSVLNAICTLILLFIEKHCLPQSKNVVSHRNSFFLCNGIVLFIYK
jgi:hypothetical protein